MKLIGKTFKANVGSLCAETIPLDPCAGSQFDLVLKFNEDNVDVTEEEVSDCGRKIAKNNFKTQWQIKYDVVTIEKLIRYGQALIIKKLLLNRNELRGNMRVDFNGNSAEYAFTEI